MKTIRESNTACELAKCLAPEDLQCGDYVAVLNVIHEFPSFIWRADCELIEPGETIQVKLRDSNAGLPLKVKAICLPFVFVNLPSGAPQTMDVRRTQFVRLNLKYAEMVWKAMKRSEVTATHQ